jgi:hypothetical protein
MQVDQFQATLEHRMNKWEMAAGRIPLQVRVSATAINKDTLTFNAASTNTFTRHLLPSVNQRLDSNQLGSHISGATIDELTYVADTKFFKSILSIQQHILFTLPSPTSIASQL